MPLVVRTWNLFHGNTAPPQRRAYLREMVELVSAGDPAVVCLQELPLWSLPLLGAWSGMRAVGAVARGPRLRSVELGRRLTDPEPRRPPLGGDRPGERDPRRAGLRDRREERTLVVSPLGERRVCQGLRLDGKIAVVNFHLTGGAPADEQFRVGCRLRASRRRAMR